MENFFTPENEGSNVLGLVIFFFICRGYTEYFCILCIFEQGFPRSLW